MYVSLLLFRKLETSDTKYVYVTFIFYRSKLKHLTFIVTHYQFLNPLKTKSESVSFYS
jgi:hypothetical protein